MVLDPMTAAITAGGYVLGNFVSQISGQLSRKWMPTGIDTSNLDLRRCELEMRERQFLDQIAAARQLKMDEIEAMRQIGRAETDHNDKLRRWPLGTSPASILSRSKSLNGTALNIILSVVDPGDGNFYQTAGQPINQAIDMLNRVPVHAVRHALSYFNNDIIFYHEIMKSSRISGGGLVSTLWDLLQTEPTILIEVNIPRPDRFVFYIAHWGGAFEPGTPAITFTPLVIDLPSLPDPVDVQKYRAAIDYREMVLSIGLSSLVVSLGDAFRCLQRPHALLAPVFPLLMQNNVSPQIFMGFWTPVSNALLSTYDRVAEHSPIIASELAAKAAWASHQAGQAGFADLLLNKALELHPKMSKGKLPDDDIKSLLRGQRDSQNMPSVLEESLIQVRGWSVGTGPSMPKVTPSQLEILIREVNTISNPRYKIHALRYIAAYWAAIDPQKANATFQQALQAVVGIKDDSWSIAKVYLLCSIATDWAKIDPVQADSVFDIASQLAMRTNDPNYHRDRFKRPIAVAWAKSNPDRALQVAATINHDDSEKITALCHIANAWTKTNPQKAMDIFRQTTQIVRRLNFFTWGMACSKIASIWAQTDPLSALKFVEDIQIIDMNNNPSVEEQLSYHRSLKYIVPECLTEIASTWAERDPQNALLVAAKIDSNYNKTVCLAKIASVWAQTDMTNAKSILQDALSIASTLQGDEQAGSLTEIAFNWAEIDPQQALIVINGLPPARNTDKAFRKIAGAKAKIDPQDALQIANRIVDEHIKRDTIAKVASVWAERDIQAALTFAEGLQGTYDKPITLSAIAASWTATGFFDVLTYAKGQTSLEMSDAVLFGMARSLLEEKEDAED